ncbi:MAG TPA: formyltetrahydrofolate deformylase [Verrucomicrobiae bacterium]|nr:formyltetrahydrofolate deformylase [Verrucomicrobiae bacterium]
MKRFTSLTVIGRDRSGVIARFTNLLFHLGANIEALEEQVHHGRFSMTLQASWPTARFDERTLRARVAELAKELSMDLTLRVLLERAKPRCAVMATKEPHCIGALLAAKLPCEIALVAGNYRALEPLAKRHGIPFHCIPWADRARAEERLLALLERHQIDFIVLARFMKILSPNFVWRWKNKIINIHPSLLPSFPGANAYRQAFEKGVRVAGVTAHFVTPNLDEGPIIWQESFRVSANDSLMSVVEKGQRLESRTLVKAVRLFLQNRFDIYWGKVHERRA